MICLSCAITKRVKLVENTFRLGHCTECREVRVVGEVQK